MTSYYLQFVHFKINATLQDYLTVKKKKKKVIKKKRRKPCYWECFCIPVTPYFHIAYHIKILALKKVHLQQCKLQYSAQFSSEPKEKLKVRKNAIPAQVIIMSLPSLAKDISSTGWN